MDITCGHAMFSPDEELKPLRQPKSYHPTQPAAQPRALSAYAQEFVPRFSNVMAHNIQERLQIHQRAHIQKHYPQIQQQQQSQTTQHQYQQQYQQHQNLNNQMDSMSVQDRFRNSSNGGGGRSGGGGGSHYLQ